MAIELNGKNLAMLKTQELIARRIILNSHNITPKLLIVSTSDDPASKIYMKQKFNKCKEIGIECEEYHANSLTEKDLINIKNLNIPTIIQSPFQTDYKGNIGQFFTADNDADGFLNFENIINLSTGKHPVMNPCTPIGILHLLQYHHIPIQNKTVCIIGRSNIVGRPLARIMEHCDATVILCHSKTPTEKLYEFIDSSDIVISAVGKRNLITFEEMSVQCRRSEYILDEQQMWNKTFVDVGMNRDDNGKLCGDIDKEIHNHCYAYTPVPNGIGPMTVIELCNNVIKSYEKRA